MEIKKDILCAYSNAMTHVDERYTSHQLLTQFLMKNFTLALELADKDFEQWDIADINERYDLDFNYDFVIECKVEFQITINHLENTIIIKSYDCERNPHETIYTY